MLPPGFRYDPHFLTKEEHDTLLGELERVDYGPVRMFGVVANRRVRHYGYDYTYDSRSVEKTREPPAFIQRLREKANARGFEEVLVTHYPQGAQIGWHRDARPFGPDVIGISFGSEATMRFRLPPATKTMASVTLEPGSLYVIGGDAREKWHHALSPVKGERYSVTFRTLRQRKS